ncbi:putative beta-galactosidase B [Porphyridium purpureum]|uniref:beta-galactosidase n=1 Tax=Porphyridium purpureum TaxID=35688 RepID=A0A5J4Z1V5_PORPP|nr:putative beta-galactosidase B [Porphyridium purpureum]|eukprot:POR0646..scf208_2
MEDLDPDRLERSSEPTAFEYQKYGNKVNFSRHAFYVDGEPLVLVSGEFHYWRVPDRERWRPLLAALKAMGLNCLRFYINWGYHSPAENSYIFDGNRDIDYLLTLCEELQLFVIAAPGPYICAETQAGGFPTWLLAKRDIRIRHMRFHFYKMWDEQFAHFSKQFYSHIVPIFAAHERIVKPDGCVIAFQIENELRELFGLDEEMRSLARAAREYGIKSPIFHNDDSPAGSWSSGKYLRNKSTLYVTKTDQKRYRGDMYGVDLYFLFPSMRDTADDQSAFVIIAFQFGGFAAFLQFFGIGGTGLGGRDLKLLNTLGCFKDEPVHVPPKVLGWTAKDFTGHIDHFESKFHAMGGAASNGPVVLAETQVGWINQWGKRRDYDDLYEFFGGDQSATLMNSLVGQGVSVVSFYMAYGGTNWGTSGDAEVYTSYDYTAFVREFGMLCERGRRLRQSALFLQTFTADGIAESVLVPKAVAARDEHISCSLPTMLVTVRKAVPRAGQADKDLPRFLFMRNLEYLGSTSAPADDASTPFSLAVAGIVVPCMVRPRQSFIAVANLRIRGALFLHVCSIPILFKCSSYHGAPLWGLKIPERGSVGRFVFRVPSSRSAKYTLKWQCEDGTSGSVSVSSSDAASTLPLLSAPLEELPLAEFAPPEAPDCPVQMRMSRDTEEHWFVSIAFWRECFVTLLDSSIEDASEPVLLLRMMAVSEVHADTLFCSFGKDLRYASNSVLPPTVIAYGAHEISMPDLKAGKLKVEWKRSDTRATLLQDTSPGLGTVSDDAFPGISVHDAPKSFDWDGLPRSMQLSDACVRGIDFTKDVTWKSIDLETQRDPLDHLFSHGHVAYRLQFEVPAVKKMWQSSRVYLTLNVRHVGTVWVNGHALGGQLTYSHNAISAGAMHFQDFWWSGKKNYDITDQVASNLSEPDANGMCSQDVIILVHSFGQNRQAFLLNDVRNKRGLLSAKLSASGVQNERWSIYGVSTADVSNPFNIGGIPREADFAALSLADTNGWSALKQDPLSQIAVRASEGLRWLRCSFKTPQRLSSVSSSSGSSTGAGGDGTSLRMPLRVQLSGGPTLSVLVYVNGTLIARWMSDVGPQNDFYVMERLLEEGPEKSNTLALAYYAWQDTELHVSMLPWNVHPISGNLRAAEKDKELFALVGEDIALGAGDVQS